MLAREAGLSLKRFYQVAAAWRERGTLDALGLRMPAVIARSTAAPIPGRRDAALARMRALLAEEPGLRTEDLLRRLAAEGATSGASRSSLLRWVADARRAAVPARPFGEGLVLDFVTLDVGDAEGRPMAVCAVMDEGSGLVLGWSLSRADRIEAGYVAALRDAARGLSRIDLGKLPIHNGLTTLRVWLPHPPPSEAFSLVLNRVGGAETVHMDAGMTRVRRPLLARVGRRIGWIRVGVTARVSSPAELAPGDPTVVRLLVGKAILGRNAELLATAVGVEGDAQREVRGSLSGLFTRAVPPLSTSRLRILENDGVVL